MRKKSRAPQPRQQTPGDRATPALLPLPHTARFGVDGAHQFEGGGDGLAGSGDVVVDEGALASEPANSKPNLGEHCIRSAWKFAQIPLKQGLPPAAASQPRGRLIGQQFTNSCGNLPEQRVYAHQRNETPEDHPDDQSRRNSPAGRCSDMHLSSPITPLAHTITRAGAFRWNLKSPDQNLMQPQGVGRDRERKRAQTKSRPGNPGRLCVFKFLRAYRQRCQGRARQPGCQ
jgi:hypothetical protein